MRHALAAWCWTAVLLVALFSEPAVCRRGGGRGSSSKSRGSSSSSSSTRGGFHSLPKSSSSSSSSGQSQLGGSSSSSSSSSRGAKMLGAAAVGAAVGYGLSSLGRSRYSRGGHSSSMAGKPGFQNPNWSEPMMERGLYSHAPKGPRSRVTLLSLSPALCVVLYVLIRG